MFISEKFYFNNVHNSNMGVILIKTDTDTISDYGVSYNIEIEKESTSNKFNHYSVSDADSEDMVLNMCLINNRYEPQIWTKEDVEIVYSHLITDDFVPFISEDDLDMVYYIKVKKIVKKFNHMRQGYLEVTFQMYSNYAYKKDVKHITVDNKKTIKIRNSSNAIEPFYYPVIEVTNLGTSNSTITIKNTSLPNSAPLILKGLKNNECVTIDNLLCTVMNEDGENRFSTCNRVWLKLKRMENTIEISGSCKVKIKCEFPVMR